ncbi:MAG: FKBP-type peptidyl-prolyl cis-trans isomerase [Bacteroidales bacterium]|nr:FKBP-type peptidyl-prolyl cis-trans isomerase [Bacteroidales bacterium]
MTIMNNCTLTYLMLFLILISTCRREEKKVSDEEYRLTKEALVGVNRILVKKDAEKIKAYANRRNWDMKQTDSGLWYMIMGGGNGQTAVSGERITLKYRLELLDGTLCYTSDSLGLKQFRIGQGGVESGLEEGVILLRMGDKARLILPPHLAHGLNGDGNRIPARAIIIYEVEVIAIENDM